MQNTILGKSNLHAIVDNKFKKQFLVRCTIMVRHMSVKSTLNYVRDVQGRIAMAIRAGNLCNSIRNSATSIPRHLKEHSSKILRIWAHQCECVMAQRVRRSQQMFLLYSKLWEEQAFKEFLKRMRQQLTKHGKEFICAACGVHLYNWEQNRIPDDEILIHKKEFEYIEKLKNNTIKCSLCNVAQRNEKKICHCPDKTKFKFEEWELFVEKDDLLIWRKMHSNGCFEYKVYGSYNDVMAEDFVNVQIDINYRKTWDSSAVVLELIEKDPSPKSNSDLVYWEMQWPRLFTNRDYVFNRRFLVDHATKTIIIANRITEHPNFPVKSDKFRVKDYWSNMVIKPYTDYHKPGLEFALTYFENSGVNIPSTVTSWVAMKAMPEYLSKLRQATRGYEAFCKSVGHKCLCKFLYEDCDQVALVRESDVDPHHFCDAKSMTQTEDKPLRRQEEKAMLKNEESPPKQPPAAGESVETSTKVSENVSETTTPPSTNQTEFKNSYWKYLQPTYYFS